MPTAPPTVAVGPDLFRLDGLVAVVTGAGGPFGRSIALGLARAGASVFATDLNEATLVETAQRVRSTGARCELKAGDVSNPDDVAAVMDAFDAAFDRLDVLVNNAGINPRQGRPEDYPLEIWHRVIDTNLTAYLLFAQAAFKRMAGHGAGGSIVNFGSISWMLKQGGMAAYTTSKAAVQGLTRSLARDLGVHGIRVNTLVPGWVMTDKQLALWVDDAAKAEIAKGQCINKALLADDISRMALFLAADDSAMCTAQDFIVDGGWV